MPERYESAFAGPELNTEKFSIKPFKEELDALQEKVYIESNLNWIIDEALKYSPVDYWVRDNVIKYIKDGKLKTNENKEYEELVKLMISRYGSNTAWKLKYIYDHADKKLIDNIIAIKKKEEADKKVSAEFVVANAPKPQPASQPQAQAKPKVQPKPQVKPQPHQQIQPKIELRKDEWLSGLLNGVGNAIWNLADRVTDKLWAAKDQVVDALWSAYDTLSDWVISVWTDAKDVPSELVPTLWKMFKEAENWMNTVYRYWGTSHKWIDCSAFVSRLLAVANGWEYVRYTTATLKSKCNKVKPTEARAWDLQYSNRWWHVEMIVSKPWKEWWKWFVNTLWSANSRPFDQNWKRISHSWPWYRKRALTSAVYRPKYDKITATA